MRVLGEMVKIMPSFAMLFLKVDPTFIPPKLSLKVGLTD